MTFRLSEENCRDLKAHALEAYPAEALGAIVAGQYVRMTNMSEDPLTSGRYDKKHLVQLRMSGALDALTHSHPHTIEHPAPNAPSRADMIAQRAEDLPFVITWTNGEACAEPFAWGDSCEIAPLVGRTFRHGVTDCYSLIRDYYRTERGVLLPEYPRDWQWWEGGNLYEDNFKNAGFYQVESPEPGDVVLFAIRSKVANHGGVYLGAGALLHHATTGRNAWDPSRLSRREPISRWLPYKTHWLRRDPDD